MRPTIPQNLRYECGNPPLFVVDAYIQPYPKIYGMNVETLHCYHTQKFTWMHVVYGQGILSNTLSVSMASNAESGAQRQRKWRRIPESPTLGRWNVRCMHKSFLNKPCSYKRTRHGKKWVEKEGLKKRERLNCYNCQFIYIRIKSPLLGLGEGKTKTKMTFELEVLWNIRNAICPP